MRPLFLVGYMGCGKSTLARKIARRLGVEAVDTDRAVEEREGATVADIFRYEGEERFREVEREVLERLIADPATRVVSTGGGLPLWRDNMARMNEAGTTVYLRRSAEQIARRLSPYGRQKRPHLWSGGKHPGTASWSASWPATSPSANLATHRPGGCSTATPCRTTKWRKTY